MDLKILSLAHGILFLVISISGSAGYPAVPSAACLGAARLCPATSRAGRICGGSDQGKHADRLMLRQWLKLKLWSSVVDPDPGLVRSETCSRIRIRKKSFRIRNEFEVKQLWKTDNIWQFLDKNAQLKNISIKSVYLVCNLTHVQDGNTKVKFMLRILETSWNHNTAMK